MKRSELLEAAHQRLEHAVLLLAAAGEEHLATDVEKLANRVNLTNSSYSKDISIGPSRNWTRRRRT